MISPLDNTISTCHVDDLCEFLINVLPQALDGRYYYVRDEKTIKMDRFLKTLLSANGVDHNQLPAIGKRVAAIAASAMTAVTRLTGINMPPSHEQFVLMTANYRFDDSAARKRYGFSNSTEFSRMFV